MSGARRLTRGSDPSPWGRGALRPRSPTVFQPSSRPSSPPELGSPLKARLPSFLQTGAQLRAPPSRFSRQSGAAPSVLRFTESSGAAFPKLEGNTPPTRRQHFPARRQHFPARRQHFPGRRRRAPRLRRWGQQALGGPPARRQALGGPPVAVETGSSGGRRHLGRRPANGRLRRGGRGARAGARGAGALRLSSVPAMEAPAARLLPPPPLLLLLLLAACAPAPGRASSDAPPLVNEDVKRTVDLSSHLAKVTAEVVLAHAGSGSSPRAASFLLALEPELEARLAHLGVQVKGEDEEENNLEVRETNIKGKSGRFFTVKLPVALDPGAKISVIVEAVYTHVLQPYPTQITQSEKQFVVFEGNHYFYSPYPTKTQTMRVKLASRNVESYTKLGNPTRSEDLLDYGPFRDVPAYSQDTFKVHSENNSPFLTITSMTRVIEVSHWGNIAVEENVDLKHSGAVLKGPFSRYDYQRQPDSGVSSVRSFKTILPAAAQDVYYRDEIGNVSTSHLLVLDDSVEMEIRPRFPLFGGWKTHYIVGYNLPSYEYLYNLGDQYALKMRLVDHVFDEQVIDSLTVKIILPEGAKNIQVDSPYEISRAPDELHYTYLDTFGRPVIVAHKENLVEQHIQDIVVHYTFNKVLMLQEPLLVVAAFYILFFTVIVYVRLDFSITKDPAAEARMKVACITEQVLTLVNKRLGLYRHFDETVNRYKQSRDVSTLNSGRKSLETEHKALTSEVALLQSRLKAEGSDLCDKVSEMQRLDAQVKELVLKAAVEAERLVAGKLKKDTYIENEKLISGKRQELVSKIDHILDAL